MGDVRSLSVVVPVFNEESILQRTVDELLAGLAALTLESYELILVENGSTDATRVLAARLADTNRFVRLLTMDQANYGAALKAGLLSAVGDAIVNFDADYYDFDFMRRALVTDGHVVVASKGLRDSADRRSLLRRLASRAFAQLTRSLLHVRVRDTHGMKLFRAPVLGLVPLIGATKDLFDTELLARAELAGLTIHELSITTVETRPSRSGILSRVPRTILGLFEIRRQLHAERAAETVLVPAAPEPVLDAA
jgi:glycosyltransferase involved in cell wall biosynthesis